MTSRGRVPFAREGIDAVLRATRPARRAVRSARHAGRVLRHLLTYRAPGELETCPVCGSASTEPLTPIPLEQHVPTYGFASGCRQCGVVFANPLPSPEQVAAAYAPDGDWGRHRQHEQEKPVSRARLEKLFEPVAADLDVTRPPAGASVLDVGCGLGGMLDGFAALGWRTFGIEPATKIAFARHEELAAIPSSRNLDVAVLHHVLEHVTEPLPILKQLALALREGGILLVSVPNLDDLAEHGELKYCIRAGVHVLGYTTDALTWLAAEAGFVVVSSRAGVMGVRHRQRVVVARRTGGEIARPATPLLAARTAMARYAGAHGPGGLQARLPVRAQAALLDLRRRDWRV